MNLGLPEIIVLFVIALLVFGPKRLPELAKSLGKGIRDFKKALHEEEKAPESLPKSDTETLSEHASEKSEKQKTT